MYKAEGIGAFYKGGAINAAFTPVARGLFMAGTESTKGAIGEGTVHVRRSKILQKVWMCSA